MEEMPDLGTHRHNFKTKWYLPVAVFSQKQLQMLCSIGKGLHGTHVSSEILKSGFRVKDLVMTLFIFSLDFNFF